MMGNVHSCALRLTALSMAFLASAAFIFCALAGFSCKFVQINAEPGRYVLPAGDEESIFESNDQEVAYIGVQCDDSSFYEDSDHLWNLSQIFFYISLAFGGLTTLLAWTLGLCLPPTVSRWRVLSILAAITAVVQVPIFLIFESDSCNYDISRQTCALSTGAYLNIVSVGLWVLMTIWTQCLKPPQWHEELDAWRTTSRFNRDKRSLDAPSSPAATESGTEEESGRRYESRARGMDEDVSPEILWTSMRSLRGARDDFRGREIVMDDVRCIGSDAREQETKSEATTDVAGGWMGIARHLSTILAKTDAPARSDREKEASGSCGAFETRNRSGESDVNQVDVIDDGMVEDAALVMESIRDQAPGCNIPDIPRIEVSRSGQSSQDAVTSTPPRNKGTGQKKGNAPCLTVSCIYSDGTRQEASFPAMPSCMAGEDVTESLQAIRGIAIGDDYAVEGTTDVDYLVRRMRSEETEAIKRRSILPPFTSIAIKNNQVDVDEHDRTDEVSEMTRGSGLMSGVSEVLDSSDRMNDPLTILEDLARTY
jgi:hypothetical protein